MVVFLRLKWIKLEYYLNKILKQLQMKKYILSLFLYTSLAIQSQTIGDIFKFMPENMLPGVSEGNKTMLIVDSTNTTVPYIFGEIKKVSHNSNYLKIETSEIGTLQLKK